jgi:MYXO-CTERM domain-containing protein
MVMNPSGRSASIYNGGEHPFFRVLGRDAGAPPAPPPPVPPGTGFTVTPIADASDAPPASASSSDGCSIASSDESDRAGINGFVLALGAFVGAMALLRRRPR